MIDWLNSLVLKTTILQVQDYGGHFPLDSGGELHPGEYRFYFKKLINTVIKRDDFEKCSYWGHYFQELVGSV